MWAQMCDDDSSSVGAEPSADGAAPTKEKPEAHEEEPVQLTTLGSEKESSCATSDVDVGEPR